MNEVFDVIVVGGGPAGLTAALYTSRRGLRTAILTQDIGGQASTTALVENYPGVDVIDGLELMQKFQTQAEKAGAQVIMEEVQKISSDANGFSVQTSAQIYQVPVVILAYGLTHRHLEVPGEAGLIGKGVTYCATCDAPLYKNKSVVVVGGGNSAMDAALLLSRIGASVTLLTVNKEFHGERVLIDRLQSDASITVHTEAHVQEVFGSDRVTGVAFTHGGETKQIEVQGVFVEIGFTVKPDLVRELTDLDARNQVIIHPADNSTSVPGLFAAGDLTTIPQKQIVISAGEGAKAALGAYQYLQSIGRLAVGGRVDWGVATPLRHEKETNP